MENEKSSRERNHLNNHRDYKNQSSLLNVKFGKKSALKYVSVDDILPIYYARPDWNENIQGFWRHHSKTRKEYDAMAEKYSLIRNKLKEGASLIDLGKNRELSPAINFWWGKECPVYLVKFRDSYFVIDGHHRIALAMQHKLGEIPAAVCEATLKRAPNTVNCS
ncbi:MAG: hypothetical protein ABSA46_10990 [Thermodesulfovibrionales bacterium]